MITITGTKAEIAMVEQIMNRRMLNDAVDAGVYTTASGTEFRASILGIQIKFETKDN